MRNDVLLFNVPGALKKKIETIVAKAADPPAGVRAKPSRPILQLKHVLVATAAGLCAGGGNHGVFGVAVGAAENRGAGGWRLQAISVEQSWRGDRVFRSTDSFALA